MKKEARKKGSHVGIVLSFVVFVVFLVFLYSILEPAIVTQRDKEPVANSLKAAIMKNLSTNLTTFSITIDNDDFSWTNCFWLVNSLITSNAIVRDQYNNIVDSYSSPSTNNLVIKESDATKRFFKIYLSSEFPQGETPTGCTQIPSDDYSTGLVQIKDYVFETRVNALKNPDITYEQLRQEFNFPPNSEFALIINIFPDPLELNAENIPQTSVYSENFPIQYVNLTGEINTAYINTRVW